MWRPRRGGPDRGLRRRGRTAPAAPQGRHGARRVGRHRGAGRADGSRAPPAGLPRRRIGSLHRRGHARRGHARAGRPGQAPPGRRSDRARRARGGADRAGRPPAAGTPQGRAPRDHRRPPEARPRRPQRPGHAREHRPAHRAARRRHGAGGVAAGPGLRRRPGQRRRGPGGRRRRRRAARRSPGDAHRRPRCARRHRRREFVAARLPGARHRRARGRVRRHAAQARRRPRSATGRSAAGSDRRRPPRTARDGRAGGRGDQGRIGRGRIRRNGGGSDMSTRVFRSEEEPITEKYAVDLLQKMLAIPSPSYEEEDLAGFLVETMSELGFSARRDEAGNAIGEYVHGEDGPTVMLLGHMDTVTGEVEPRPEARAEAGRLYGRGAVDAKGPLAAMICAARRATDFTGRVIVVGAVEEETDLSRGATNIRETLPQPDALIIGEPSGWSTVVLGYKGKLDLRYEVTCEPTHPTNPVPKAAELAGRCWAALLDLLGPDASHDSFEKPGANLTSFVGDLTKCAAEFSVRTPPGFDSGSLVEKLRMRTPHGRLTVINSVDAYRVGRTDPVVKALNSGVLAHGSRPRAKLKTATSDLNILTANWRVPVATYGPGDSELDHSADEHIDLTEYLLGVSVLTTALHRLSRLPADAEPARPAPSRTAAEPVGDDELAERAARIREQI